MTPPAIAPVGTAVEPCTDALREVGVGVDERVSFADSAWLDDAVLEATDEGGGPLKLQA